MNLKFREIFEGQVVNKALTTHTGVDEFPRYVLEYLIDNDCPEETFHADMEKVVRRLNRDSRRVPSDGDLIVTHIPISSTLHENDFGTSR